MYVYNDVKNKRFGTGAGGISLKGVPPQNIDTLWQEK